MFNPEQINKQYEIVRELSIKLFEQCVTFNTLVDNADKHIQSQLIHKLNRNIKDRNYHEVVKMFITHL